MFWVSVSVTASQQDKQIFVDDYNKKNGKGLKKETVAQILGAE